MSRMNSLTLSSSHTTCVLVFGFFCIQKKKISIPAQFCKYNIGVYLQSKLRAMALATLSSLCGLFLNPILRFETLSQAWDREAKPVTVFQVPLLGPKIKYCKIFAHMFCLVLTADIGLYLKLASSSPCGYCWDKNSLKRSKENFH